MYCDLHRYFQGGSTPEDLSKLYKTPEESEEDDMATRGLGCGAYGGAGAMNVGNGRVEKGGDPWRDDAREPRETADSVAQTAKVAAVGVVETGLRLGKMAKQTADGLWEAAEKTAENVRDSVADSRGRRAQTFDELGNSGVRRPPSDGTIEERSPDEFVKDLRRKGGGYDVKDRW